jgi:hypothetical protein
MSEKHSHYDGIKNGGFAGALASIEAKATRSMPIEAKATRSMPIEAKATRSMPIEALHRSALEDFVMADS